MAARFIAMPDSLLPLMTKVNREDCVDFLESQMAARVKNRFGDTVEMTALTSDYLRLQLTVSSTLEMKLLPVNDSVKVTCAVTTVEGPVADSQIRFYDAQWQEIPLETYMEWPTDDLFFQPVDTLTDDYIYLRRKCDMYLVKATLSADAPTLTFAYTAVQRLAKEDREALEPKMRKEPVVYEWKGDCFTVR
jgi:hypothetical protein